MTKRAALIICDGLRSDHVQPDWTPNLWALKDTFTSFTHHTGVYPSTTRTSAAAIATGCLPGRNGLEGNCMALPDGNGWQVHSVGPTAFRDKLEAATGRTLLVPTLAELLKDVGGVAVYSNVSPGAGLFHDPDGYGTIHHRTFGQGPGRAALPALGTRHDTAGDDALTDRFIKDVLHPDGPAFAVLWQCEPDHSQHDNALGSDAHIAAIQGADRNAGRAAAAIANCPGDWLTIIASDHGHETVSRTFDVDQYLIAEGLKEGEGTNDVAVASQGLSVTIYLADRAKGRLPAIQEALAQHPDIGDVMVGDGLLSLGMSAEGGADLAAMGAWCEAPNEYGVPGQSVALQGSLKISIEDGCGQHGGIGKYEQSPFLMIRGHHFPGGESRSATTCATDIAPTVLQHFGIDADAMCGRALA